MAQRAAAIDPRSGTAEINGTGLYYETRGGGPAALFISGATGDAGHFAEVAELLSDEFTVVTYDRRANSRSPRPEGWDATSTDEQGDDAAALIEALGLAPAMVYGNSGGAIIALNLAVRRPELVHTALFHEPPLLNVLENPDEVMGVMQPLIEEGMAEGGPRGAVQAFLRFAAGESLNALDQETRERMFSNGETLFGIEFGVFEAYRPDDAALASIGMPVHVLAGGESASPFKEAAEWLAGRVGVDVTESPGAHTPQFDRPRRLVEVIRPLLLAL